MNNPGHYGSHFNKNAEELARTEQQTQKRTNVPQHVAAQTEEELLGLIHDVDARN